MSNPTCALILRANAIFLLFASSAAFLADIAGSFFAAGPVASMFSKAPYLAIGSAEAHGLAFILGVLLWRAVPGRQSHLTAAGIHILLGSCNLLFWDVFVVGDVLAVGYVTTVLHWLFVALQLTAAASAAPRHVQQS
ncbi:hypothetical protein [Rhizobium sp. CNPSo 3490]|uniref:hypothetical protein n=1 Tax=Rhizobium sp. CNPSo 3490 TaxID=3021407 RepID=UPI00254C9FA7|nr:hypothetical protein [Rhizobium sp. CNPSo 3490]MDK4736953.1 hypothetical protein [Rhizobium sp. CNPSo 3490]